MSVETLLESFPAYAKDIKLNLSSVLKQTELRLSNSGEQLCMRCRIEEIKRC